MARSAVVVFCMPERGHLQRLLPLIEGLSAAGRTVHVLTDARYRAEVTLAGGRFHDVYAEHPIEAADATSIPVPSRYVTYAACYAEALTERVAGLEPGLIVYDTFAVIAPLIARRLGIPYINVCAGHAVVPSRAVAALRVDPRVATSAACAAAVERLREVHGMLDASPFSYVAALSPFLNVYGEPPQFLDPEDRRHFEPLAFFGSLSAREPAPGPRSPGSFGARPRIYVSFGTVIWRYFEAAALAALTTLSEALAERDVAVTISLGGHRLGEVDRARLSHPNVRVEGYVDQWRILKETDVFITHHGLNSTHESIFHEVPMVSYPFFGDQPALSLRCQALGLAVPLAAAPRAAFDRGAVLGAIDALIAGRPLYSSRLAEARAWELATIAARPAVIDRILAL